MILEAICRACEQRGFPITTNQGDRAETQVLVLGENLAFKLEEAIYQKENVEYAKAKRDRPFPFFSSSIERYTYSPSGKLRLRLTSWIPGNVRQQWGDGVRRRVESLLNEFMVGLVAAAYALSSWRKQREAEERRRIAEEQRRELLRQWTEQEAARGRDLEELAQRWRLSERIRSFVQSLRQELTQSGRIPLDGQMERWLKWAKKYADKLDPFLNVRSLPPPFLHRSPWDSGPAAEWPALPD
jgi:hypothetical protein